MLIVKCHDPVAFDDRPHRAETAYAAAVADCCVAGAGRRMPTTAPSTIPAATMLRAMGMLTGFRKFKIGRYLRWPSLI